MNFVTNTMNIRLVQLSKAPQLIERVLETLGIEYLERVVSRADQLSEVLRIFPAQLVVLDLRDDPDFDAATAIAAVKSVSAYSKVICVADRFSSDRVQVLRGLGAEDCISADQLALLTTGVIRALVAQEHKQRWFATVDAFEAVYHQSHDAIITGSPNGIFFNCNDAALKMFGYASQADFLKLMPVDLCTAEQPDGRSSIELVGAMIAIAMQEGSATSDVMFKRQSGEQFLGAAHIDACAADGHEFFHVTIRDISAARATELQLAHTASRLNEALRRTVDALVKAIEARDLYTAGHQKRVGALAYAIGERMGLPKDQLMGIYFGGVVHDIGKIQVPAEILMKPGKLTPAEYLVVQAHALTGHEILKNIDFSWPVAEVAHQHHERMDGSGYPQGLSGEQITLEARIVAVADVIEAMSAHRPYRPSLGVEKALKEIRDNRGTRYDADVVDACLDILQSEDDLHRLATREIPL